MTDAIIERPQSREVAEFLALVLVDTRLKDELKKAKDDTEFIEIAVRQAGALGVGITHSIIRQQIEEDRRMVRFMSLEEVEAIADSLLGARLSGGHKSHMPPKC